MLVVKSVIGLFHHLREKKITVKKSDGKKYWMEKEIENENEKEKKKEHRRKKENQTDRKKTKHTETVD